MSFRLWCNYKKMPVCDLKTMVSLEEDASLWPLDSGVIIRRCQSVTFRLWYHYKKIWVYERQTLLSL